MGGRKTPSAIDRNGVVSDLRQEPCRVTHPDHKQLGVSLGQPLHQVVHCYVGSSTRKHLHQWHSMGISDGAKTCIGTDKQCYGVILSNAQPQALCKIQAVHAIICIATLAAL